MDLENEGDMEVLPMMLDCICDISSIRLNLPNNLMKVENQIMVKETLKNVYFYKKSFLIKFILRF